MPTTEARKVRAVIHPLKAKPRVSVSGSIIIDGYGERERREREREVYRCWVERRGFNDSDEGAIFLGLVVRDEWQSSTWIDSSSKE